MESEIMSPLQFRVLLESIPYDMRCQKIYSYTPKHHDRNDREISKIVLEYSLHMGCDYSDEMRNWYAENHDWFTEDQELKNIYLKYHGLYAALLFNLSKTKN